MKISYLMYEPVPALVELDRRMAAIKSLGYHGIELVATHPLGYELSDLIRLVEKHRQPVVSLLSGWSYANEGLCLASKDADVRARAVARLGDYIGHAAQLGAIVVVGLMQGLRSDEADESVANDRIAECLRQAARLAEERGVRLVIEPVNHLQVGFNHTAAAAAALAARVGSRGLSYMLDTIHMNIEERSMIETIRAHGPKIRHFHLCETNGGPFGTGALDFERVLAALGRSGYDHYASVKVYRHADWASAAESSAAFLRRLGYLPA